MVAGGPWSPEDDRKLLLNLINPSHKDIDYDALADLFEGRTPKAILERTAKLRREAKSCSATTNPTSTPAAGLTKSSKQPLSKKGTNTNAHFAKYNNQNNNEEEKEEGKSRDLKVKSPHRPRSGGGGEVEGGRKRKVPPLATTATKQEQEQESENEIVKETGKRIKLEQELDNEGIGE